MNGRGRWFVVATAVHLLAAWWLLRQPLRPRPKVIPSVTLKIYQPKPLLTPVAERAKPAPVARSSPGAAPHRPSVVSSPAPQQATSETGTSGPSGIETPVIATEGQGALARQLTVPSLGATAGALPALQRPRAPTDLERAQAMLEEVKLAAQLAANTRNGTRGVLTDLHHALREEFYPTNDTVDAVIAGRVKPTRGPPPPRPITEDRIHASLHPAVAEHTAALGSIEQSFVLFDLITLIRMQHREGDGVVQSASVQTSSGVPAFDAEAMTVAEHYVGKALPVRSGEPVPLWSDWRFQQTVYKYGSAGKLEPGFRPPGKPDPKNDVWIDTELQFVTAMYRKN